MESKSRFRMNLFTGEIEIEGTEEFISSQISNLSNLTSLFVASTPSNDDDENELSDILTKDESSEPTKSSNDIIVPASYGEWSHKFRKNITETDKTLIAGYFVQNNSTTNDFKTSEVTKILKENGVKLSNPTAFIKGLANSKYVFQTRKVGKLNFMRVSQTGLNYLKTLLES